MTFKKKTTFESCFKIVDISVDHLTPGYYCTLPRNMARRHKQGHGGEAGPGHQQGISRNSSLDGSMNEVMYCDTNIHTFFTQDNMGSVNNVTPFWNWSFWFLWDLVWISPDIIYLCPNWLLMMWNTCWATSLNWDPLNLSTKWAREGDSEHWTQHGVVIKQIIIRTLQEDHYNMSSKEQLQPWTTASLSGHNQTNSPITWVALLST